MVQNTDEQTNNGRTIGLWFGHTGDYADSIERIVREDRVSGGPRWRVLVAAMVVCSLAFGGCLTLDPSVTANTGDSAVFGDVSVSESWSSQRVRAQATLAAGPAGNVTQITVVTASGTTFSTVNLNPGQTSVVLELPANRNSTLVASDTVNGTTIETLNVTTGGNKLL